MQRGKYDTKKYRVIKNECKFATPSEYFIKKPSSNEKISYKLVSLIMRDGKSLDCEHYFSDVFDTKSGILWHCDDSNIKEISNFTEGFYTRESLKLATKKGNLCQALNTYCLWFISEITTW